MSREIHSSVASSNNINSNYESFKEKKVYQQGMLIRKLKDDMAAIKMELIEKNILLDELTNPSNPASVNTGNDL